MAPGPDTWGGIEEATAKRPERPAGVSRSPETRPMLSPADIKRSMDQLKAEKNARLEKERSALEESKYRTLFQERLNFLGPKEKREAKALGLTILTNNEKLFLGDLIKDAAVKIGPTIDGMKPEEFAARLLEFRDSEFVKSSLSILNNQSNPQEALSLIKARLDRKALLNMAEVIAHAQKMRAPGRAATNPEMQAGPRRAPAAESQLVPKVVRGPTKITPAPEPHKPSVMEKFASMFMKKPEEK